MADQSESEPQERELPLYWTPAIAASGLIIATILNIMNLMGIQSQPQLVIKGFVILIAVFFSSGDAPPCDRSARSPGGDAEVK